MASLSIASTDPLANARRLARVSAIVAALIVCLAPHYACKLILRRSPWPRLFLGFIAWALGARVRAQGERLRADVFYVANHVSWFDILVIAGATGAAFVAKDDVRTYKLVGWLASLNSTVFVSRGDRLGVGGQIDALREAVAGRQPIAIFPEGTTGEGDALLPFKPSLLAAVSPPPKPIRVQPVLIDYGAARRDIAWVGDEPGGENVMRVLGRRGNFPVALSFLEPFDPAALPDRKAIAAEARARIAAAFPNAVRGV